MTEDHEGPVAMKLLQGYLWHPATTAAPTLPESLGMGAHIALDEIRPPMAFFDNGEPTARHNFYQLTVLEIFPTWPSNEDMHAHAVHASQELDAILNATDPSVGWQLSEDLRPA